MNYLNIDREKLSPVVDSLNQLLADYHVYYQNLRNFHWNIVGENFFDLHEKFETLYSDAQSKIDAIAERILTLRYAPVSNMSEYLDQAEIDEAGNVANDKKMVDKILLDHKILIETMRRVLEKAATAEDEGTIDLISAYMRNLEKSSWMLNAWTTRKLEPLSA